MTWEEIDGRTNGAITGLTYSLFFTNDQIYNYVIEMRDEIRKTEMYKHRVKKMDKYVL